MKNLLHRLYEKRENKNLIFVDRLLYRIKLNEIPDSGASMAFYIILGIFPFLIALLNIIKFSDLFESDVLISYLDYFPKEVESIFISFIREVKLTSSPLLLIVSAFTGLWSSSNGVRRITTNINAAYGESNNDIFIIKKIKSIFFTIAILLVILLLSTGNVFGNVITKILIWIGLPITIVDIWIKLSKFVPLVYMALVYTLLYWLSPVKSVRKKLNFKNVSPGVIFSTLGTVLITQGYAFYVNSFAKFSVTYGTLATFVVMLIWIWLMSIVILIGAQINATVFASSEKPIENILESDESILKKYLEKVSGEN